MTRKQIKLYLSINSLISSAWIARIFNISALVTLVYSNNSFVLKTETTRIQYMYIFMRPWVFIGISVLEKGKQPFLPEVINTPLVVKEMLRHVASLMVAILYCVHCKVIYHSRRPPPPPSPPPPHYHCHHHYNYHLYHHNHHHHHHHHHRHCHHKSEWSDTYLDQLKCAFSGQGFSINNEYLILCRINCH